MTELIILVLAALAMLFFLKWRAAEDAYDFLLSAQHRELDRIEEKNGNTH